MTLMLAFATTPTLPSEVAAMCEALRDGQPLAATPIADAVAQYRGKRVERDKYDSDEAFAAKVAALTAKFPEISAPLAISFRLDEDRIEYHPASEEMTFPHGPTNDWCPGIYYGDETPGSPVCVSEVVRSVPGKPYTASNAFGVKAMVTVLETTVAGIYLGNEDDTGARLAKAKMFKGLDRRLALTIAPAEARRFSRDAESIVVLEPRPPFFLSRSTASSAKIDMPREERVSANYVAGKIACSAVRYRKSHKVVAYREPDREDPYGLRRAATPRGNPSSWVTSYDGTFDQLGLNLMVGTDGQVSNCWGDGQNIGQENKACTLVSRRARFSPALDASGQPMPQLYRFELGATQ